jgi:hypothetical protein
MLLRQFGVQEFPATPSSRFQITVKQGIDLVSFAELIEALRVQTLNRFISEVPMSKFNEGDEVKWKWGNGYGDGEIQSIFAEKTTRTIEGYEVTRNGTQDDPALYIKQDDGGAVLKLASEVEKK